MASYVSKRKWMIEEVKLHSFTIIIFYRSQKDALCREYILSFQDQVEKIFHYRGFVFAVSTDSHLSLFELKGIDQKIPLISDPTLSIVNLFGTDV